MRRVILNMKDYIFADAVAKSLQADEQGDFNVVPTTTTEELLQYGKLCEPYAVLTLGIRKPSPVFSPISSTRAAP